MSKRLLGVILLAVLAVAGMTGSALAVEEHGGPAHEEMPTIDEVGSQSDTAREFFPEPYEAPSVFPWFGVPLMIGAGALSLFVLIAYLVFQPRFASERTAKAKSRKR